MRRATLVLVAALAAVAPGCAGAAAEEEEGAWVEWTLRSPPPRRDLLEACQWAALRAGYPPGELDLVAGEYRSGWLMELQPFYRDGRRHQAVLRVEDAPAAGTRPGTRVRVRVITERNMEEIHTLEPAKADWDRMDEDESRALIVMQHLRSQLHLQE